jgi:Bacterial regulatory protein, arsR family.
MGRDKTGKDSKDSGKTRKKDADEAAAVAAAAARRDALEAAAERYKALGDPTRLAVVLFLKERAATVATVAAAERKGTEDGAATRPAQGEDEEADTPPGTATVGEIGRHVFGSERSASTLSHHLKELRRVGLVRVKRRGKHLFCRVETGALEALSSRLDGLPRGCSGEADCDNNDV